MSQDQVGKDGWDDKQEKCRCPIESFVFQFMFPGYWAGVFVVLYEDERWVVLPVCFDFRNAPGLRSVLSREVAYESPM